ncbi:hypothetical protein [Pseudonocardia oroxyli]|uniref:Uncharacterized protein n=1 Tax=Pseudonocardia oroxyli TaxID=366584 RepID=A0A1G7UF52_PSEOR|nr:hypothetical protein [Pseudonocardia oroxyli]SDG46195.1 hypothetical protein SAMN05216377_11231 [Pseudonocardia oroxyli]
MLHERPPHWTPLLREAAIAAESLFSGLNALRKADHTSEGRYSQAFFGITIGLERLCKLAILLDSKISSGHFPSSRELKREYRHDLTRLFAKIDELRAPWHEELRWSLPDETICRRALQILSGFAQITRYYNLGQLTGDSNPGARDPIEEWYDEVGGWILRERYTQKRRARDESTARQLQRDLSIAYVGHTAEDGTSLDTVYAAALHELQTDLVQQEGVVICACLGRHVSELLRRLVWKARTIDLYMAPDLDEFFPLLNQPESVFRRRRRYSAYC